MIGHYSSHWGVAPGRARGVAAGRQTVRPMKYYLYILKRLKQHNSGKTASTKSRKPFILVYTEIHNSRKDARQREIYLKSYAGVQEKRKILKNIGE